MPSSAGRSGWPARDSITIRLLESNRPAEVPPHWMPYFAVADVEAALQKVAALGGKTCVPPFDSPYGRISVIEDAQGGMASLIGMAKPA